MIIQLDLERDKRARLIASSASSVHSTRNVAFPHPLVLEDRLFSEAKARLEFIDAARARVLLFGFESKALADINRLVRAVGVSSCAFCSDVMLLNYAIGMEGAFTHLLVNFDAFESPKEAVVSLMAFRSLTKDFILIAVSASVEGDDLTTERKAICDATLRAPLSVTRLRDGIIAASANYKSDVAVLN